MEDASDGRFHDELLNHLIGKWNVTGTVHGVQFSAVDLEASWVMNHQYVRVYEKSREVVPWLGIPFEREFFIGYNHSSKRYVIHEVSVFGPEDIYEGFCYAYRKVNEFTLIQKAAYISDSVNVQRLTWEPKSGSWRIEARWVIGGKEEAAFIDQKVEAVKSSSK